MVTKTFDAQLNFLGFIINIRKAGENEQYVMRIAMNMLLMNMEGQLATAFEILS